MLFNSLAVASLAGLASARTVATSSVKGKAFDRMAIIYFENENYAKSIGDEDFAWLASKGITLTNSYGVTHPSQPNYVASISGDYFGLQDDGHAALPDNVFTVIDLLESKDISWAHYQEDMPFAGYQNESYVNQKTGANDYVRKHNPGVHFANVVSSQERLQRLTTFSQTNSSNSQFHRDLANDALPQWMFITPNMTSDGHDTDVKFGGRWCRAFLEPLLNNKHFMENTMVLISWDEAEIVATRPNQILGILLGDAIPKELVGTSDNNFYTHYSSIATVSANWDLPTLGRWDVGANVFSWVAKKTGDVLHSWCSSSDKKNHYYATPYAGYLNPDSPNTEIPSPNLALSPAKNGRSVLPAIVSAWKDSKSPTYYTDSIRVADGRNPPKGYEMD